MIGIASTEGPHRCPLTKRGQFDILRCCLPYGHDGDHNWVVAGVREENASPRVSLRAKPEPRAPYFSEQLGEQYD